MSEQNDKESKEKSRKLVMYFAVLVLCLCLAVYSFFLINPAQPAKDGGSVGYNFNISGQGE